MPGNRIITVFGATGGQGGGVVDTFLSDPELKAEWTVRGVTRDVGKESSKKLAERGAEVVAADTNDKATLVQAMSGAHTVFAVTNYWEKLDAELETQQGKNLADAAKEAGVQHFIWSSLLNVTELSKGALPHVYHFDSKAKVEDYVRSLGIPASFFLPGFYMTNLPGQMFRPAQEDGAWTLGLPVSASTPIPLFLPSDSGKYVAALVRNRDAVLGQRLLAASEYLTAAEVVEGFKRTLPAGSQQAAASARFFQVPEPAFRAFLKGTGSPDFVVDEMLENMLLMQDFGYYGGASLEPTHKLVQGLTSWEEYAKTAPGFKDAH